jgi:hypothetical protein
MNDILNKIIVPQSSVSQVPFVVKINAVVSNLLKRILYKDTNTPLHSLLQKESGNEEGITLYF